MFNTKIIKIIKMNNNDLLSINKKPNKTTLINNYVCKILHNIDSKNFQEKITTTKEKSNNTNININDYNLLLKYNYSLTQLKIISKTHNLKITGNKYEYTKLIYMYLFTTFNALKIQKLFKTYIRLKFIKLQGPGKFNKNKCTNNTDFYSMDELINLPKYQFFSYTDVDNFIYGFDVISLNQLLFTNKNKKINAINPYNRNEIPNNVYSDFKSYIRIGKILKYNIIENEPPPIKLSLSKTIELKALSLFQKINLLGNYSDHTWYLNLTESQLIKFVKELTDIWEYRANLSKPIKCRICPPHGNPFSQFYYSPNLPINTLKSDILYIIEKLITNGLTNDDKQLGAYYVLGALTIVSTDAANAIPWLYQTMI